MSDKIYWKRAGPTFKATYILPPWYKRFYWWLCGKKSTAGTSEYEFLVGHLKPEDFPPGSKF